MISRAQALKLFRAVRDGVFAVIYTEEDTLKAEEHRRRHEREGVDLILQELAGMVSSREDVAEISARHKSVEEGSRAREFLWVDEGEQAHKDRLTLLALVAELERKATPRRLQLIRTPQYLQRGPLTMAVTLYLEFARMDGDEVDRWIKTLRDPSRIPDVT